MSDGTECWTLLKTGASNPFMVKTHYLRCTSLHLLPKYASKTKNIQVGNGKYASALFTMSAIFDKHNHRFEIFTLVSDILDFNQQMYF